MERTPTWGPFTGRQLTTIIVAVLLTLVPGAVWATATFSNVAIYDPQSEKRAAVDSDRSLRVGDGGGAMTVDGVVRARPAPPGTPFVWTDNVVGGGSMPPFRIGRGTISITDIVFSQDNSDNTRLNILLHVYEDGGSGDCSSTGSLLTPVLPNFYLPAEQPFSMHLATPIVVESSEVACFKMLTGSNSGLFLGWTITGYKT
jgi:hypothetical protein